MFEIERGIPVPPLGESTGRNRKYPFLDMEVGESFFVPYEDGVDPRVTRSRVCMSWQKIEDKKFCSRRETGGVRVWRIK